MTREKGFYGIRIVIGSLLLTIFSMAIINNASSFFMQPICDTLGFTVAEFSAAYSMAALGAAAGAMLAGTLIQKMPIRVMMTIGAIGTALGFAGMSLATNMWHFYVLFFIADCSMALITNVPIATMLSNWYKDKRGTMTGLVFAGSGLGAMIFAPLTEYLIANVGWQTTAMINGGIILATALPVSLLVFYKSPADIGQKPFTYPEGSPEAIKAAAASNDNKEKAMSSDPDAGLTRKEAFASPAFWLLAAGLLFMGFMCSGVMVHIPTYLGQLGMNAGFVMALLAIASLVGTFASGYLMDKIGLVKVLLFCGISFSLGMVFLFFTKYTLVFAFLMSIFVGLSVCIAKVGPPMLTSSIFGMKDYSFLYGLNYTLFLIGAVIGPVACGIIYQANEDYGPVWLINIAIAAGMFIFSTLALKAGSTVLNRSTEQVANA